MVEDMMRSLPTPPKELVFKKSVLLRGTKTAIKQGNEIIYPDDLKAGKITIIELPEF